MQHQFVITIDSRVTPDFALTFLKNINFIKAVKLQKEKEQKNNKVKMKANIEEVTLISQESLSEEWLSEEDNRWDKVL